MPQTFPILLVDDDSDLGWILNFVAKSAFPEARFHQVRSYQQTTEYIHQLEGRGPKLILLDLNLNQEKSGLDVFAFLQDHPVARRIPVVILTNSREDQAITNCCEKGATSYIVKPTKIEDWRIYFRSLRTYWHQTVTLTPSLFVKQVG